MPVPRKAAVARSGLDHDRLHQLATGMPIATRPSCGWGLPWKWSTEDRERNLAAMREAWQQHRDQVVAYVIERSGGTRSVPWAARQFDAQEAA